MQNYLSGITRIFDLPFAFPNTVDAVAGGVSLSTSLRFFKSVGRHKTSFAITAINTLKTMIMLIDLINPRGYENKSLVI